MNASRLPRRRLLGLGGALLLGACGGAAKRSAGSPIAGGRPGVSGTWTVSAEQPRYGGTLVQAQSSDPGILNPGITTSTPTHTAVGPLFNGLVGLDTRLQPVPDLAVRWSTSADALTYSFDLAPNVLWHDGRPCNSADVKFTFEQILLKFSSRTRSALGGILDSIETPTPTSVAFRFKAPYSPFLSLVDKINAPILPQHLFEGQDPQTSSVNQHPVGTGAFIFSEGVKSDHYTYLRNTRYFKSGQPYLDKIVVRVLPDGSARELAFERGEVDFFGPDPTNIPRLKGMARVVVTSDGAQGFANILDLAFNLQRPMLQNACVRQAIAHAIDKEFVVQTVYSGLGKAATGPISSQLTWAYDANVTAYPHDPAKANQLLEAAGFTRNSGGVRFKLIFPHEPGMAKLAEVLRDQLRQAGIDLELQQLERNAWIDRVYTKREFDFSYTNFENGPDPDIGVKRMFITSNIGPIPFSNEAAYSNPQVDQLFSKAAQTPDRAQRAQLYGQIQRIVTRDIPYIYLVETPSALAYHDDYRGLIRSAKSSVYYEQAWWSKGKPSPA